MKEAIKVYSKDNDKLYLKVTPGHFASDRFHVNYYIDMSTLKMRMQLAKEVAKTMSTRYISKVNVELDKNISRFIGNIAKLSTENAVAAPVDTIICMDGCEVIGAYLADELANAGVRSMNKHESFYVITPEFDTTGQMVVRENIKPMIQGKNVLVVLASAMSGRTIAKSIRCITSYGGKVQGISVIFSNVDEVEGYKVHSVFNKDDLKDFALSEPENCEDCKNNVPLDAIVNSYGYEKI